MTAALLGDDLARTVVDACASFAVLGDCTFAEVGATAMAPTPDAMRRRLGERVYLRCHLADSRRPTALGAGEIPQLTTARLRFAGRSFVDGGWRVVRDRGGP